MRFGRLASNRSRNDPMDPVANFYKSADERWLVVNPRGGSGDWPRLAKAAGREELVEDERFKTGKLRKANNKELVAELDAAFAAMPFVDVEQRLDAADLAWSPTQTPAEVVADPQVLAAGAFVEVEDGQGGVHLSPAAPAQFPGSSTAPRPPSPGLGQHTHDVLREAGFSDADIAAMLAEGAAA
jgi:crotonobetainyl-CoA:carnitine CoA-transferase CaiB-like acyl-CoA transferase